MTLESAMTFVAAVLLWVSIPGPACLMVVGRSLSSGFRSTLSLIGGILLGDLFWMSLVLLGLTALGKVLGEYFVFVRILAAIYLIYLGISLWIKNFEKWHTSGSSSKDTVKSFFTGFGVTLGNPKAILFHLGFLPTFFDLQALTVLDALAIMGMFLTILGSAFAIYAYGASKAGAFFKNPSRMLILNRASGALLIGAGVVVLVKRQ